MSQKCVGELTYEERKEKVNRYLRKKMRRKWSKKINYHSRKKVADTRPRFKGRFVSVDQADEFNRKLELERQEKLRKERIFVIQKMDKKTGLVLKTMYPTYEVYQQDIEHMNSSEPDSQQSKLNIVHNNEILTYIKDVPLCG